MTSAVTAFHSQLPVRIAFGDGVIGELPDALSALGAPSALVVVEEPVAGHPDVVAALAAAESAGVRLDRVVKGPGEPTFALADELAARVRDGALDAVVGIGGGSALDVAKAARIVADQGGGARDYADGDRTPEPPRIGLVLCPTTSGTGSEVSGASVLTDTERDRKIGFGHPNMRAQHALVDPVLTHGLPAGPDGALGRRRDGAGDRRVHRGELVPALGRIRPRGLPPRRPLAPGGGGGRIERRGAPPALVREPDRGPRHEPLRLRGRPRARTGARQRQAPAARPDDRARRRRDARRVPRRTAPTVSSGSPTRSASRRTKPGRRTAPAPCAPSDACWPTSPFPTLRDVGVTEEDIPALVESATGEQSYNLDVDCHAWSAAEVEQAFRTALALESR